MRVVEAAQRPLPVIVGRCRSVRLLHFAAARLSRARLKIVRSGMIIFVSVSMFDHKPERCPFGHSLWPGMAQVGWQPCICTAAQEAAERGRGMGHLWVSCNTCHDQLWQTTFYQPPHDINHHQPGPW